MVLISIYQIKDKQFSNLDERRKTQVFILPVPCTHLSGTSFRFALR
jgi:hypothetical protein